MKTEADWTDLAEKLDAAHRAQHGIDDDAKLTNAHRFGRPGLFIRPGSEKDHPLEYMQRRYAKGERTELLFDEIMAAT